MAGRERVLVVDDDRAHLDLAEEIIGEHFDVMLAVSGVHALDILQDGEIPDLILLDVDMPVMDGYETFCRIREIEAVGDVPIIFLTGKTNSDTELVALKLGAQDYITKPFIKENLLVRINLRLDEARRLRDVKNRLQAVGVAEEKFISFTSGLTQAERKVAQLIIQGYGNHEIAGKLNYTIGYVNNIATLIYGKLSVRGRRELRAMYNSKF